MKKAIVISLTVLLSTIGLVGQANAEIYRCLYSQVENGKTVYGCYDADADGKCPDEVAELGKRVDSKLYGNIECAEEVVKRNDSGGGNPPTATKCLYSKTEGDKKTCGCDDAKDGKCPAESATYGKKESDQLYTPDDCTKAAVSCSGSSSPGGGGPSNPPSGPGKGDQSTPSSDPNLCNRLQGGGQAACQACMGNPTGETKGFWTGIGCISTNPVSATRQLLELLLGVGGFFVVTQILIGSFTLIISRGNPQALEGARTRIVNSVMALLLIVFSVTILEFVGVSILNIPGFFDGVPSSDEDCMKECRAKPGKSERACEQECNGV